MVPFNLPSNRILFLGSVYCSTDPRIRKDQLAALHNALAILHVNVSLPLILVGDFNSVLDPLDSANDLPGDTSPAARAAADLERRLLAKHHLADPWRDANPSTRLYSHFHPTQHPRRLDRLYTRNTSPTVTQTHLPDLSDHSLIAATLPEAGPRLGTPRRKYGLIGSLTLPDNLIIGHPSACPNPHAVVKDLVSYIQRQAPPPTPSLDEPANMYSLLLSRVHLSQPADIHTTLNHIQQHTSVPLLHPTDPSPQATLTHLLSHSASTLFALRLEAHLSLPPAPLLPLDSAPNLNAFLKALHPKAAAYSIPPDAVLPTALRLQNSLSTAFAAPPTLWGTPQPHPLILQHLLDAALSPEAASATATFTSAQEIENIITSANNSSPGPDGLRYRAFCHPTVTESLAAYANHLSHTGDPLPASLSTAILIMAPKPGTTDILDGRPLVLQNAIPKILAKLLAKRLYTAHDAIVGPSQHGFRANSSIYAPQAKVISWLRRPAGTIIFFDLKGAFNTTSKQLMLTFLQALNFHRSFINLYKALEPGALIPLLLNRLFPNHTIPLARGVKQGDPASPPSSTSTSPSSLKSPLTTCQSSTRTTSRSTSAHMLISKQPSPS